MFCLILFWVVRLPGREGGEGMKEERKRRRGETRTNHYIPRTHVPHPPKLNQYWLRVSFHFGLSNCSGPRPPCRGSSARGPSLGRTRGARSGAGSRPIAVRFRSRRNQHRREHHRLYQPMTTRAAALAAPQGLLSFRRLHTRKHGLNTDVLETTS